MEKQNDDEVQGEFYTPFIGKGVQFSFGDNKSHRYKFKHIHHGCNKLVWCPWAWIVLKMMSSKSELQSFPEESWWRLVLKSWAIPQINDNEVEDDENDDMQMKKRRHQHCCRRSRRRFHQFSRWFLGNYDIFIFYFIYLFIIYFLLSLIISKSIYLYLFLIPNVVIGLIGLVFIFSGFPYQLRVQRRWATILLGMLPQ